jgi:hypothetical protein
VATLARDDRPDATCFADEVAIDFPSVALALDRIRRGFMVDEPTERWQATVHLSAPDARRGATVPMEVPVRCTCSGCGGRGESWAEPCGRCHGAGMEFLRHALKVTVPAGAMDGDRFHFTLTPRQNTPTRVELRVLVR